MPHALPELPLTPAELTGPAVERLLLAARALAAARDLGSVMEVVRRAARDLSGADGITFVLREGDLVHYADEEAISPLWKGCRFPADACISGWAMIHRAPVVIEDVYADPRIPQDAYRPTFVKSLLMVPVGDEDPVAAIGAYWASRHRASSREVHLLQTLAGFVALALQNDALVQELRVALRARDELLSLAAHELRTPLTALQLVLGKARRGGAGERGGASADAVERADRHVRRLGSLLTRVLEISRMTREPLVIERQDVDLAALAREVVERQNEDATVVLEAAEPVYGSWDRARLALVVESLLANVLKFGSREPVEVAVRREADAAVLVVRDRGIELPAADQARIFGRLGAIPTQGVSGLALGLWIVRQNVEAHGGTVVVESAPGSGATFTVKLPAG
jgi:signal transduction histidine kinase